MYQEGSGKVKKTDYLDNKVMVESLRSAVALLEKNEAMARPPWPYMGCRGKRASGVRPGSPFRPYEGDLEKLVGTAYRFSPTGKLEAGIRAAEGAVRTAKSGHYPRSRDRRAPQVLE